MQEGELLVLKDYEIGPFFDDVVEAYKIMKEHGIKIEIDKDP